MTALAGNGKTTVFADAGEFNCSVALARLAVELARVQGRSGSADEFLHQAMDLICHARDVIQERKL